MIGRLGESSLEAWPCCPVWASASGIAACAPAATAPSTDVFTKSRRENVKGPPDHGGWLCGRSGKHTTGWSEDSRERVTGLAGCGSARSSCARRTAGGGCPHMGIQPNRDDRLLLYLRRPVQDDRQGRRSGRVDLCVDQKFLSVGRHVVGKEIHGGERLPQVDRK